VADDFDIVVLGLPEIENVLDKMPFNLAKNMLRESLHEGGDVFADAMQSACPVGEKVAHLGGDDPGALRNSIVVIVKLGPNLDYGIAKIGPLHDKSKYSGDTGPFSHTHSPGVYGMFVEFGTHLMRAIPFIRPAFHAVRERALEVFAIGIGGRINQLVDSTLVIKLKE